MRMSDVLKFAALGAVLLVYFASSGKNDLAAQAGAEKKNDVWRMNVRDFGARGDGKHDDSEAIQQAIDAAKKPGNPSEVFIPTGTYRITKTLVIEKIKGLIVRGQGSSALGPSANATTLLWDGPAGGTLMKSIGIGGCVFYDFNFAGRMPTKTKEDGEAGVLYSTLSETGWGNMINKFSGVCFYGAETGIEMNSGGIDMCNSDMHIEFVTFRSLGRGFVVKKSQGVNFLFNFLFGLACDKVIHFEQGGNLQVNDAQLTNCGVFLEISGGGRNVGTYTCVNVRVEHSGGGKDARMQLLVSRPKNRQANVKFIGYDDCQWNWSQNRTDSRETPLCEIGPGSLVTIESSIFSGPVASLTGDEKGSASLVLRECSFGYIRPENAVRANEHGFFKILNPVTDSMKNLPDVVKWPPLDPIELPDGEHQPSWK